MIKPGRLREGDRLAAVTLSWGGPGAIPWRYQAGKRQLEEAFGVSVIEMPYTCASADWVSKHPQARAEDLMQAFADPSIDGIVSSIGGDDSLRISPFLDLDVIRQNPKVFIGYSDTTVSLMACRRAGLVTFYGPSIMSGFAENGGLHAYLREGVDRCLFDADPMGVWPENRDGWTVEHLDWTVREHQQRERALLPNPGWKWLQGREAVEGQSVASNLEVLDWLRGTEYWPDLTDAVLALETSEEAPSPVYVSRFFRSLARMNELHRLRAILFGRPGGANLKPQDFAAYDEAILRVVRDEEGMNDIPVVTGMDFGHTDPMWTIPIGIRTRVDPVDRTITFLESPTI